MDFKTVLEQVSEIIRKKHFNQAEEVLLEANNRAVVEGDVQTRMLILSELVELYCIMDTPQLAKAEALSREREGLAGSAYSRLQTAMILHHGAHDFTRAVPKLEEAIAQGRTEQDEKTVYTALSLLGEASLELGRNGQAIRALDELEQMVERKGKFVVGDETRFLEALYLRHVEPERVTRLASTLASACRDRAFKERLQTLSMRS
jgi:hypothetical protein